jgi:hypothetical protein
MTKLYHVLFAAVLLPLFSIAQSNYKPGFVVNLKGDTIHGSVDYKEWDNNPREIAFKSGMNETNPENYSIKNTLAFTITGLEQFQRFILPVSTDPVEISKLPLKLDTTTVIDTVFLKVNTKGKYLTLFRYTDNIKTRFFLLEAGHSQPEELIYHAFYNADQSSSVQYVNRYRNQLAYLAQKYAGSNGKLDKEVLAANYDESDLIKIIQTINGGSSKQSSVQNLSGSRWFAGIGVNYSTLELTTYSGTSFGGSTVNNSGSVLPKITAGIDVFANQNVQSLIFRAELSVTASSFNISNTNNTRVPHSTSSLEFTQLNGAVTPQLIYNIYNKQELKVFIDAGAALNFAAYNQYQYVTKYENSLPEDVQSNYPAFDKFWVSFPIKAGITLNNKIEINVCYIPPSTIVDDTIFKGNISSFGAGVNYLFGK